MLLTRAQQPLAHRRGSVSAPLMTGLLSQDIPVQPLALLTARGRFTGHVHTTPLALLERAGQRCVAAIFGEVPGPARATETEMVRSFGVDAATMNQLTMAALLPRGALTGILGSMSSQPRARRPGAPP